MHISISIYIMMISTHLSFPMRTLPVTWATYLCIKLYKYIYIMMISTHLSLPIRTLPVTWATYLCLQLYIYHDDMSATQLANE